MSDHVHPRRPLPATHRRSQLRRLLESRGVLGGHRADHVVARLRAADGTLLAGTYLPGPPPDAPAVLLLHGLAAHRRKPAYAFLADTLSHWASVLAVDLRGHGQSKGRSTLGDREYLDVAAAVDWLRAAGHDRVVLVGLSMGGTAALHAASRGVDVQAIVTISTPALVRHLPDSQAMQRLHDIWHTPWKRHGMSWLVGVRVVSPVGWAAPPHPVDAAREVTVPLLAVHGTDDAYFPSSDAGRLVQAAGGPATLWEEPAGFGHAEDGVDQAFCVALGRAIVAAVDSGRFPPREEVYG